MFGEANILMFIPGINEETIPKSDAPLNHMAQKIHATAKEKGFWSDLSRLPGDCKNHFWGNRVALIHSEASELLEELRKSGWDKDAISEELGDIIIRCLDFAAGMDLDIDKAINKKMGKNNDRETMHGGKRF